MLALGFGEIRRDSEKRFDRMPLTKSTFWLLDSERFGEIRRDSEKRFDRTPLTKSTFWPLDS